MRFAIAQQTADRLRWPLHPIQDCGDGPPIERPEEFTASSDWGQPGGRGRMITSFLGRAVTSDLELTEWDPPRAFRYTAGQRGRPDLDNRRVFEECEAGTRLTGTTRMEPRPGLNGLIDRLSLHVLHRIYRRAMDRLPDNVSGPGT